MKLATEMKNWHKSFFYSRAEAPEKENPLLGFRNSRLVYQEHFNSYPSDDQRNKIELVLGQIKALLAHGLLGTDLTRCWVEWQVQPLSVRDRLMCEYSGLDDPMRYAHTQLAPAALVTACRKYLANSKNEIFTVGLAPFCVENPAPAVSL